jgi:uncharacterized membrane protein YeaQ/YmgE (transglycosylase-associated protein family)
MDPNYAFVVWVMIGAAAGALGGKLIGGGKSAVSDIVAGMTGASAGGALASAFLGADSGGTLPSLLVSLGGACLLIGVWWAVKRRPHRYGR